MKVSLKHYDADFFPIDNNYALSLLSAKVNYKLILPLSRNVNLNQELITEIMKEYEYVSYDDVCISQHDANFSKPHSHPDNEARWTIVGVGYFFIPIAKSLVKIEVRSGDFIIINSNVVHWYEFPEQKDDFHSVVRFFSHIEGRITNYVEGKISIKRCLKCTFLLYYLFLTINIFLYNM